jgi:3-oxoacyl-[acyl-carrier protein] reductase
MKLSGETALITGAASGLGRALSVLLGQEGMRLGLVDVDGPKLSSLAKELSDRGVPCATVIADVRDRQALDAAVRTLTAELGEIYLLVASAGILRLCPAHDLMVDRVEEALQVNFLGAVYAINAVLPDMLRRGRGQIVGIASLAASRGIPYEAAYGASKAALGNYLESLRPGLMHRGIAVTTVYPGFIRTPLLERGVAQITCQSPLLRFLTRVFGPRLFGVVEPDEAARKITAAIRRRRRVLSFPLSTRLLTQLAYRVPAFVYDWAMNRFTERVLLENQAPAAPSGLISTHRGEHVWSEHQPLS